MSENNYIEVYTECYGKLSKELRDWDLSENKKRLDQNVFQAKLKHESIYKSKGLK